MAKLYDTAAGIAIEAESTICAFPFLSSCDLVWLIADSRGWGSGIGGLNHTISGKILLDIELFVLAS